MTIHLEVLRAAQAKPLVLNKFVNDVSRSGLNKELDPQSILIFILLISESIVSTLRTVPTLEVC